MKPLQNTLTLAVILGSILAAAADVPSLINYQGRLTDALGVPQPGTKVMSVKIYDAATAGTQLYSESLGSVAVDANGVYAFQFGATGTSSTLISETIATTDGTSQTFQKTLSNTPVVPGTASVTDGTFSWNEVTGNPGTTATATSTVAAGFVIGATVTNGGSGYTTAPIVTITGNGSNAAATATVSAGAVTSININNAGSGYNTGATITIAPPPSPFLVTYAGSSITTTYATPPPVGKTITATYRYTTDGISGALAAGAEQWLELSVGGVVLTPRQRVLAVPFAMRAGLADKAAALVEHDVIWRPETLANSYPNELSGTLPLGAPYRSTGNDEYGGIPAQVGLPFGYSKITKIDFDFTIPYGSVAQVNDPNDFARKTTSEFWIRRERAGQAAEDLFHYSKTSSSISNGHFSVTLPVDIPVDATWVYKLILKNSRGSTFAGGWIHDVRITGKQ